MRIMPWILALLSGLWFGWRASRSERLWLLWSLGGGLFALVVATIIFGLRHATCIPFSDYDRAMCHLVAVVAAVVIIAGLGWLMTLGLEGRPGARGELGANSVGGPSVPGNEAARKGPG